MGRRVILPSDETTPKFRLPPDLIGNIYIPPRVSPKRAVQVSLEGKAGSRVDPTKYRGNGHWVFPEDLGGDGYNGFIYIIRDIANNKLYLGKKNFSTLKKVEGTTRRQKQDLNWRWYISSSKELSEQIKIHGKQKFEFIAIEQYKAKGALSYAETWSLMYVQSPYRRDIWYNLLINKVSWVVKEPITQRHIARIDMMLKAVDSTTIRL